MANQEHVDILAKGVAAWNAWRKASLKRVNVGRPSLIGADLSRAKLNQASLIGADLSRTDFSRANLSQANLSQADLSQANLSQSDLSRAAFHRADLRGAALNEANLSQANLSRADLSEANLSGANLTGASLSGANLSGTDLNGTDFGGSAVGRTSFAGVDLSVALNLESVKHLEPSTIGIDTIYRSGGKIPEVFLRGCGVPDYFITYMHSLTGAALDFYSVFISYSTQDQTFADRLHADLQARGVRCWFAPHDIQGGKKIHEQIDEAIKVYDKLLLILSDASMGSNWVKTEIANARAKETQQRRQMLFPLTLVPFDRIKEWKLFDADTGIDSAREIREYFVPDFSNWKDHGAYQRVFDKMVRDLKTQPEPKGAATSE
ncbi:MAG: toll/interleukin-1 receptor domain-containing protein [Candidatus Solibacter sp.]